MHLTFEQVERRLRKAVDKIDGGAIVVPVINAVTGVMTNRIHKRGLKVDGSPMSKYSPSWAKVRKAKGRQTSFKDLDFTGSLRNSLTAKIKDNKAELGIYDEDNIEKREDNERREGKIWGAGELERKEAKDQAGKAVLAVIKRTLASG